MLEVINEWELVEAYCQFKNKCVVYFRNPRIVAADATKQQQVWDWYADFAEDQVLDAMKTMGTWDMVTFDNVDVDGDLRDSSNRVFKVYNASGTVVWG